MSLILSIFLFIIFAHWVSDWVLQSHWMASNKSSSLKALTLHTGAYTLSMLLLCLGANQLYPTIFSAVTIIVWTLANGLVHGGIDFFTSKLTARLWSEKDWHNFFVAIGFDQLLHYLTLGITFIYVVSSIVK